MKFEGYATLFQPSSYIQVFGVAGGSKCLFTLQTGFEQLVVMHFRYAQYRRIYHIHVDQMSVWLRVQSRVQA